MAFDYGGFKSGLGEYVRSWAGDKTGSSGEKPVSQPDAWETVQGLLGGLTSSLGFDEAKAEKRALLEKAVGTLEPYMDDEYTRAYNAMLGRHSGFMDTMTTGIDELLDPNSQLNLSAGARIRTGARSQLSALGQNAAAGAIPTSQSGMLDVMQNATDRLAQMPAANMAAAMELANAASGQNSAAMQAASQGFLAKLQPASQIAGIYAGTDVDTPLMNVGLGALQGVGQGLGNYFGRVAGYPWSDLNPTTGDF